ncbi:DNA-directed RNA polymerase III subunit RPC5 [Stylophora pistillata]|uniref:DNA-directed RNA polymerase III subunit RPC5 n=1 Tax=Stylophora pistillata TaxID=50429 RepID=A0A2B4RJ67_STYPI|nr:DNA-directed RNA polymerase III subunit RPC5 [Stylophora pistillata]
MGIGTMYFSPLYDLFLSGDEVYLSILRFQSRDQNWRNHFRRPCWKIYKAFKMADATSSSHIDIVFDDYWLTLDDVTKARYCDKALLFGFDPYKLKKSNFSEDLSLLPTVQYPDIMNYLVVQMSWTTMLQMKSYKAMEAYNCFVLGADGFPKVELELSINTSSNNYYVPRGEQIAHDVDGSALSSGSEGKESFFSSDKMDKQVLSSSRASEDVSRYSVGLLKEGELHLTPVHGVLQLRPSFEYLNKGEANVRQASNLTDEGDSQDEEEEAKPLTVKFARPETERAKAQRLSSYKYLEQKKAEEPWKTMEFYNPQNDIAGAEHCLLFCRDMDSESPEFHLQPSKASPVNLVCDVVLPKYVFSRLKSQHIPFTLACGDWDYLKLLTPSASQEESSRPPVPNNVLSMTQLKTMDLADQVRALLINAKVISFSQLCRLLSPAAKEASILKCLQQYAVLVQGCWVVKSELLYPEGTISPSGGISADILCKGRDYLMWRFNQSRVVVRKDINSVTKDLLERISNRHSQWYLRGTLTMLTNL